MLKPFTGAVFEECFSRFSSLDQTNEAECHRQTQRSQEDENTSLALFFSWDFFTVRKYWVKPDFLILSLIICLPSSHFASWELFMEYQQTAVGKKWTFTSLWYMVNNMKVRVEYKRVVYRSQDRHKHMQTQANIMMTDFLSRRRNWRLVHLCTIRFYRH